MSLLHCTKLCAYHPCYRAALLEFFLPVSRMLLPYVLTSTHSLCTQLCVLFLTNTQHFATPHTYFLTLVFRHTLYAYTHTHRHAGGGDRAGVLTAHGLLRVGGVRHTVEDAAVLLCLLPLCTGLTQLQVSTPSIYSRPHRLLILNRLVRRYSSLAHFLYPFVELF